MNTTKLKMIKQIWLVATIIVLGTTITCARQLEQPTKTEVKTIVRKVANWQNNYYHTNGFKKWLVIEWVYSTYYVGLQNLNERLKDKAYHQELIDYSKKANWKVGEGKRRFFADDYLIGDIYVKLYKKYKDPSMISDFKQMADELIARKKDESFVMDYKTMNVFRVMNWADAVFMGPPSLFTLGKITKENKYNELADSLFWKSYDFLYDKKQHLFFRDSRFFNFKEKNGQQQFWSRGNGWVMAGLARILDEMPKDFPTRKKYEALFVEMAEKVITLQQADGMWRSSLLAPELYPAKETSGTGFYCYALAWGINRKLLSPEKFKSSTIKSWNALVSCVQPDGKLGFVQKIGDQPEPATSTDTDGFGTGAFLLAGAEMLNLK
jgi:unsaturated rhamnogalacturonyl hydrolase